MSERRVKDWFSISAEVGVSVEIEFELLKLILSREEVKEFEDCCRFA